jgi:adenylate kinase family enzyme
VDRILVFGNSGYGKSTLAQRLGRERGLAHLDLDTLAWLPEMPPRRQPLAASARAIDEFTAQHDTWVIEGCYTDLLRLLTAAATELIFMDLAVEVCVENARQRPWEPHNHASKAAQDANLAMLIDWIRAYPPARMNFLTTRIACCLNSTPATNGVLLKICRDPVDAHDSLTAVCCSGTHCPC